MPAVSSLMISSFFAFLDSSLSAFRTSIVFRRLDLMAVAAFGSRACERTKRDGWYGRLRELEGIQILREIPEIPPTML
jgi:hypothetical protein